MFFERCDVMIKWSSDSPMLFSLPTIYIEVQSEVNVEHTLIYLAEDNDAWKLCLGIPVNLRMEDKNSCLRELRTKSYKLWKCFIRHTHITTSLGGHIDMTLLDEHFG
jgi:hypothetical protein